MTIKELREALRGVNPDAEILFDLGDKLFEIVVLAGVIEQNDVHWDGRANGSVVLPLRVAEVSDER